MSLAAKECEFEVAAPTGGFYHAPDQRQAMFPLAQASVKTVEDPSEPGTYYVLASIEPRFQVDSRDGLERIVIDHLTF